MSRRPRLKLYWCWTVDHHEDWFVVARGAREARRFHDLAEGYDGEAQAELVAPLPEDFQDEGRKGWPTRELLTACGAEILRWETPRVVVLRGVRYGEGMLDHVILQATDDLSERLGAGRPNGTSRMSTS